MTALDPPTSEVLGPQSPHRSSRWALAAIEADAFVDTPEVREQWPILRRGCVRVAMWVLLLACERRVANTGNALCLLAPRTVRTWLGAVGRLAALGLTLFVLLVALAVLWQPLALMWLVALLVLVAPCAWSGWRNRRAKSTLASFTSGEATVYVHSIARAQRPETRGDGAAVMRGLTAEADKKLWRLSLDAGAPRLVEYYRRFGFEATGPPVEMTWGEAVRMVREPGEQGG
jgi:hypothetical protein